MFITCRVCKNNNLIEEDYPTYRYRGSLHRRRICRKCYYKQSQQVPNAKQRRTEYHKKWRSANPGSCMIVSRYHMSQVEYTDKLNEQNNACAICKRSVSKFKKKIGVDHDHKCCPQRAKSCGKCRRGLLCTGCNAKLGWLEQYGILKAALEYLVKYHSLPPEVSYSNV